MNVKEFQCYTQCFSCQGITCVPANTMFYNIVQYSEESPFQNNDPPIEIITRESLSELSCGQVTIPFVLHENSTEVMILGFANGYGLNCAFCLSVW